MVPPLVLPALFGAARLATGMAASMAGTTVAQTVQQVADTTTQAKYRDYDIGQFARQVRDIGGSLKEFRDSVVGVTKGLGVSMTENAQAMKTATKYGGEQGGPTAIRTSGQSAQDSLVFAVTNGLNRQMANSIKEALGQSGIVGGNSSYSSTSQQFERMFSEFASIGKMGTRTEGFLQNTASYVTQQANRGVTGIDASEFTRVQAMASLAAQQPGNAGLNTIAPNAYKKLDLAMGNVSLENVGSIMPGFIPAADEEITKQKNRAAAATKRRDELDKQIANTAEPMEKARLIERRDAENNNIVSAQRQASNMEGWKNSGGLGAAYAIQNSGTGFQASAMKHQLKSWGWSENATDADNRMKIMAAQQSSYGALLDSSGQKMTTMEIEGILKAESQRATVEKNERIAQSYKDSAAGRELASGKQTVTHENALKYTEARLKRDSETGDLRGVDEDFDEQIKDVYRRREEKKDDDEIKAGKRTKRRTGEEIQKAAMSQYNLAYSGNFEQTVASMVETGEISGEKGKDAVRMNTQKYSQVQAQMTPIVTAATTQEVDKAIGNMYRKRQIDAVQMRVLGDRARKWEEGGELYNKKLKEMQEKDPAITKDSEEFQTEILNSRKQDVQELTTKGTIGGKKQYVDNRGKVYEGEEGAAKNYGWIGDTFGFGTKEVTRDADERLKKGGPGGDPEAAAKATVDLTTAIEELSDKITPFLTVLVRGTTGTVEGVTNVFPGRAFGGAVSKNKPYLVGERGPEIFSPPTDGTILTNSETNNITRELMSGNLDSFISTLEKNQKTFFSTASDRAYKGAFGLSAESSLMQNLEMAWYSQNRQKEEKGPGAESADGLLGSPAGSGRSGSGSGGSGSGSGSSGVGKPVTLQGGNQPSQAEINRFESIKSLASAGDNQGVGRMVAAMEGGGNYGAYGVLSSRDSNYGLFQFNVQAGVADKFVQESGFLNKFGGAKAGSAEFAQAWKEQATHEDFQRAQWDFAQKNYLQSAINNIRAVGEKEKLSPEDNYYDLRTRSDAVKELVFSAAIQGPGVAKDLASATIKQLGPGWKDEDFIDAFQKMRKEDILDKQSGHFTSTSMQISESIAKRRYETERQLAHYRLAQERSVSDEPESPQSIDTKAIGGLVNSNTPTIVGEKGPELLLPGASASVLSSTMTTRLASALNENQSSSSSGKEQRVVVQFVAPDGSSAGSATIGFGEEDQFIKIAIGESWKL